jgi:hypothetical protein
MGYENLHNDSGYGVIHGLNPAKWVNVFYVLFTSETYIGNRDQNRMPDTLRVEELDFRSRKDKSKKIKEPNWVRKEMLTLTIQGGVRYQLEWAESFWRISKNDA